MSYPLDRDPLVPFFLAATVGNLDGSIDPDGENSEGTFDTERDAVDALKRVQDEYPTLTGFVYHCTPVAKVERMKSRVSKIGEQSS